MGERRSGPDRRVSSFPVAFERRMAQRRISLDRRGDERRRGFERRQGRLHHVILG